LERNSAANIGGVSPGFATATAESGIRMKARGTSELLKVAFDASALKSRYDHHGIQVYTRNLLGALRRVAQPEGIEIRPFLPSEAESTSGKFTEGPGLRPRNSSLMRFDRLWRYGGATAAAFLDGADIMLNPNGASLSISTLLPAVTVIHDLTPMVMPCFPRRIALLLRFLLTRSAKSSAAIITVSENSRQDIVRICGVPESKVHVVYEGYDRALFNSAPPQQELLRQFRLRLGITRPYILHHGAIQPRKNLPRLIAACRRVLARNPQLDFDLVLAGPLAWQHAETVNAAKADENDRDKVILTGALSDHDLSLLVRGASLEVIPSLYEGFCLPMVEAMACGVPTIASNNSCLPEVSGGVLRYFDPRSVEDMAARMEEVLLSPDLQAELAHLGRERAQKFSWDLCAEESLGVLEQVAGRREVHSRAARVAL
jgi:glycosyltransferase involved in cell wall biosynthesis